MNIYTFLKRFKQRSILRKVCQQAQLYLRVVDADQFASLFGNEYRTYFTSKLGTHRNVLQVRVFGAEPSRCCTGLQKGGMNAALLILLCQFQQRNYISREHFLMFTVGKDFFDDGVFIFERHQHGFVGTVARLCLLAPFEPKLLKEYDTKLLSRADVELCSRQCVNLFGQ